MAVALNVNAVQPFDAHGDASSLCQRWQRWLCSFELIVGASGVTDDSQKRQLLLHCAGESVQDIFFTLADTGNTYENAKAKITSYFTPRKNTSYNRHMFRKDCQNVEESVAQYVTRLRQLAHLCEFGDQVDDFIRDQVINNGRSKSLRTKLLAERDLNLDRVLDLAGAMEASESQAAQIAEGGERSYMVYGKKQSGRPTQRTMQQNQKRQPQHFHSNDSSSSGMQYSGSGKSRISREKRKCLHQMWPSWTHG